MVHTFQENYLRICTVQIFWEVFETPVFVATWPPSERSPPHPATNIHSGFCPSMKSKTIFVYLYRGAPIHSSTLYDTFTLLFANS